MEGVRVTMDINIKNIIGDMNKVLKAIDIRFIELLKFVNINGDRIRSRAIALGADTYVLRNLAIMVILDNKIYIIPTSGNRLVISGASNEGIFKSVPEINALDLSDIPIVDKTNLAGYFHLSHIRNIIMPTKVGEMTDLSYCFKGCGYLDTINISLNINDNISMNAMFRECVSLREVKLINRNFDRHLGISFISSFENCYNLERVIFEGFNDVDILEVRDMFSGCHKLKSVNMHNFKTTNIENMANMFNACFELEELDISNFTFDKVLILSSMFRDCQKLEDIGIDILARKCVYYSNIFDGCTRLKRDRLKLDHNLSTATSHIFKLEKIYYGCRSLEEIDLGNVYKCTELSLRAALGSCCNLKRLHIGNWDNRLYDLSEFFVMVDSLKEITFESIDRELFKQLILQRTRGDYVLMHRKFNKNNTDKICRFIHIHINTFGDDAVIGLYVDGKKDRMDLDELYNAVSKGEIAIRFTSDTYIR